MAAALLFFQSFSDIGPIGLAVGVGFFLVIAAAAYIAFRVMRRTVKMALRMAIVGVILLIAIIGSIAIFWMTSGSKPAATRPSNSRSR